MNSEKIIIYESADNQVKINVISKDENVWINRDQMAELFGRSPKTIDKHVIKAVKEELEGIPTVAKFATVQKEGSRDVMRDIQYYNLDMIISVGYRVKSKRGIMFRIWANEVLKEHMIKGYSLSKSADAKQLENLKNAIKLLSNTKESKYLSNDEATGLLKVITDYSYALDTLDKYDYQQLKIEATTPEEIFHITYDNAIEAINTMKIKFGSSKLFGNEKDSSFKSSLGQIYQTFDKKELYPSIEEKASMLLYLVVKNHSFTDGNKRIAAALFLIYLNKNKILYRPDGTVLIENNALIALTLMIAESRTEEKDIMIGVVVNLINRNSYRNPIG